ncbi:hypothetical protein CHUAL_007229 [Chamberlinius hualienensis]
MEELDLMKKCGDWEDIYTIKHPHHPKLMGVKLNSMGWTARIGKGLAVISDTDGTVICIGKREGDLFVVPLDYPQTAKFRPMQLKLLKVPKKRRQHRKSCGIDDLLISTMPQ